MKSEKIDQLSVALAKAQLEIKPIRKNKEVSAGSSNWTYSDFPTIVETCQEILANNGLCISQIMSGTQDNPCLNTILMHSSGQWIESAMPMYFDVKPSRNDPKPDPRRDPQHIGSAISYYKRYCYCAIVGITTTDKEDDDATSYTSEASTIKDVKPKVAPKISPEQCLSLRSLISKSVNPEDLTARITKFLKISNLSFCPLERYPNLITWITKSLQEEKVKQGKTK